MPNAKWRQIGDNWVNQESPTPVMLLSVQLSGDEDGTFCISFTGNGRDWVQDPSHKYPTQVAAQTALNNYAAALNAGTA